MQEDARNLTHALKGDSKTQGDWGEEMLETVLEKSGLEEGIHYTKQDHFKGETSSSRTDFIVHLPDKKHLVLDAKVSLTDYERYFNSEDDESSAKALKAHLNSMWKHVVTLSEKNYQGLDGLNAPDYVLMFVPVEGAFSLALKHKPEFFTEALKKNVVLVTVSTLMATLKTVSYIWKQDNQSRNIEKIAKAGGALYDKIVGYLESFQDLGKRLNSAQQAYEKAEGQLYSGKGNIVRKTEQLRELGAEVKPGKYIPEQLLDKSDE